MPCPECGGPGSVYVQVRVFDREPGSGNHASRTVAYCAEHGIERFEGLRDALERQAPAVDADLLYGEAGTDLLLAALGRLGQATSWALAAEVGLVAHPGVASPSNAVATKMMWLRRAGLVSHVAVPTDRPSEWALTPAGAERA